MLYKKFERSFRFFLLLSISYSHYCDRASVVSTDSVLAEIAKSLACELGGGGAICSSAGKGDNSRVVISGCTLLGNTARYGGGIYVGAGEMMKVGVMGRIACLC